MPDVLSRPPTTRLETVLVSILLQVDEEQVVRFRDLQGERVPVKVSTPDGTFDPHSSRNVQLAKGALVLPFPCALFEELTTAQGV